jgi:hypothetical protein
MSYLYRHALFVSRKQPYIEWANSFEDDGPTMTEELSRGERVVYLVPEGASMPVLADLLDQFWEDIFEAELESWMLNETDWPQTRTREVFDEWFEVELSESVYDLTPDEPLTQEQIDIADLADASARCAACGLEIEPEQGRFVPFKLADRSRFEMFEGRVFPLPTGDDESVLCIVTPENSDEAETGGDLIVRACSSRCEKVLRKIVPKGLRDWLRRVGSSSQS